MIFTDIFLKSITKLIMNNDDQTIKYVLFNNEKAQKLARWQLIINHDPAYNPNLTRSNEEFSIGSL